MKDYYKILEILPSATNADVKKSFRRLALKFHPDKNFGNQLYEAKFKEIKEAYDVLSDADKRREYNYRRNEAGKYEKNKARPPKTPQSILLKIVEFRKKVAVLDPDRTNTFALFHQIQQLLSKENIIVLQQSGDQKINEKVIEEIITCSKNLGAAQVEHVCLTLTALAGTNNTAYQSIYNFSRQARLQKRWDNYKVFFAILVGFLLCLLVYSLSVS
jgi:molecular chaperone DnaJ